MHIVYRLFDANEQLLYVGRTSSNLHERLSTHRGRGWWSQVDFCYLEFVETRELAKATEDAAIRNEEPLYNVKGSVDEDAARKRIKRHQPVYEYKPGVPVQF